MSDANETPYLLKNAGLLKKNDCFLLLPETGFLGPCLKVIEVLNSDTWEIRIKGIIMAISPKVTHAENDRVFQKKMRENLNGVKVYVGDEIEIQIERDSKVGIFNPEFRKTLSLLALNTTRTATCKGGYIRLHFHTIAEDKWQKHLLMLIRDNLMEKNLHISDVEILPNVISGTLNCLVGHHLFNGEHGTLCQPIQALTVRTQIQPQELPVIQALLMESHKPKTQVTMQPADGDLQIELTLKGKSEKDLEKNYKLLLDKLKELYLQYIPEDETEQEIKNPLRGFIIRHPDTLATLQEDYEGQPLQITF